MNLLLSSLLVVLFALVALVMVPPGWATRHVGRLRQAVVALVATACLLAIGAAVGRLASGGGTTVLAWSPPGGSQIGPLGIYFDGISSLMVALVSFVGFVVARFSVRYLDGDPAQARYFRWLSFTIGAVALMVVAGNLLLLLVAWMMTSFGLHHLLLHYPDRPGAQRAAWTKFAVSRIGDVALVAAFVLCYRTFGSLSLADIFAQLGEPGQAIGLSAGAYAIPWLIVLGAITKSAQVPFHSWLPNTLETPTPVSALMHAGIVNAGGYLVIRLSPLVVLAPWALTLLAVVGLVTVCVAGLAMMAQPSVKRMLAYSTVAQMGFMMLQCGLGAFAAAMLHIVAHSLYKAYAFLNSGNVLASPATIGSKAAASPATAGTFATVIVGSGATFACLAGALTLLGDVHHAPGAGVLACILCLALTTWGLQLVRDDTPANRAIGALGVVALCLVYALTYSAISAVVGEAIPTGVAVGAAPVLWTLAAVAFAALLLLTLVCGSRTQPSWLAALRVHASQGFYFDAVYRRLFGSLSRA